MLKRSDTKTIVTCTLSDNKGQARLKDWRTYAFYKYGWPDSHSTGDGNHNVRYFMPFQ